jgi:hypothetical protein
MMGIGDVEVGWSGSFRVVTERGPLIVVDGLTMRLDAAGRIVAECGCGHTIAGSATAQSELASMLWTHFKESHTVA